MWIQIKSWASTVFNLSVVVSVLWLVKLLAINLTEWKGSTFDFFYEYKFSAGIALAIVIAGMLSNMRRSED